MLANMDVVIISTGENKVELWEEENLEGKTGVSVCQMAKGGF